MLCEVFSLCSVWCLDASDPRSARVWLASLASGRFAAAAAISPNMLCSLFMA